MMVSSTFIPTQRVKDLLCALFVEYGFQPHKQRQTETRQLMLDLRAELGADEFGRFQQDFIHLMRRCTARRAVAEIIRQAVMRAEKQVLRKLLKQIYEPA